METRDQENSTLAFLPDNINLEPVHKDQLRERIKIEFYKTYDVMTGIRIAATLGGFFSMMILLVLYKNYCKPSKTLSEEQLNAAVTAAAEEEDRALQAALEATSFYTALDKRRQSIEPASQVLLSPRFSSVGGGYSHLTPPLKVSGSIQQRGKSLPGSVLQFGSARSPSLFQREDKCNYLSSRENDSDGHPSDLIASKNHLNVCLSRRVSSVTCFSADSAYLERRCSAFEMGLPVSPHFLRESREKLLGRKQPPWDYYYPIDIQVIQPTPEMSPTASERNLNEDYTVSGLQVPGIHEQIHSLAAASFETGLAPLASISSFGGFSQSSSITSKSLNTSASNPIDNQEKGVQDSIGSDSVFMDLDELATDSEFEYDGFDDDYSFCESKQKPPAGRADLKNLQFASFDSYDTSINQDVRSEMDEEEIDRDRQQVAQASKSPTPGFARQFSTDSFKRHPSLPHEGSRLRRKLVKTYSEPRSNKVSRALPSWTEKGRSGYLPKRQMSSPSRRRNDGDARKTSQSSSKYLADDRGVVESNADLKPSLQASGNVGSGVAVTPGIPGSDFDATYSSQTVQGLANDMPLTSQPSTHVQLSLPITQERRSRLQKQRNFTEDMKLVSNLSIEEKTEAESAGNSTTNLPETAAAAPVVDSPDVVILAGALDGAAKS